MTITSVEEIGATRQGQTPVGQRALIRILVISDINTERAATVLHPPNTFNIQVPVPGDSLEDITGISSDSNLVCLDVIAARDRQFFKRWVVTANYGAGEFNRGQANLLPWERTPVIRYPFSTVSEPIWVDVNGDMIVNFAGVPPDPPVERQFNDPAVVIQQFQKTLNYNVLVQYQDAVNSDVWVVPGGDSGVGNVAPGQAKVMRIEARELWHDNDVPYFDVTYEVHMREFGWKRRMPEMSMLQSNNNVGPPCFDVMTDDNGVPLNQQVPIDTDGKPFDVCGATPLTSLKEIYTPKQFDGFIPGSQT